MGASQGQQHPDQARPPGSVWVWAVAALLLLCLLAGGACLVLYLTLAPADAPQWLAPAGLGLVALPWAFWIATGAYRCCCSAGAPAPAPAFADRQPSSARKSAVVPLPSSKNLKSALAGSGGASTRRREGSSTASSGSPTTSSAVRRVRFGEATVLGEEKAPEKDDASSVHSNESEAAPLASSMQSSSSSSS